MDVWETLFPFITLCLLCIAVSVCDLKWRRIPNRLLAVGFAAGIFFRLLSGILKSIDTGNALILPILWDGVLGVLAGGLPWLLTALLSLRLSCGQYGIGGGDIKFYGMCGIFLGLHAVLFSYFILAFLCVFILGILWLLRRIKGKDEIPFGPLISAAVMVAGWAAL